MIERTQKLLHDILRSIELVEVFSEDINDFEAYQKDYKTQSVVERQLVIIGEALSKIRKMDIGLGIKNDQQIIGFRNRLVHAYDSIDNAIVWVILKRHLSRLKEEVKEIIE